MGIVTASARTSLYPPGHSPFQVKGTFWMGVKAYAEEHVAGGNAQLAERLDANTRDFFSQLFVAAGWYDLFPMLVISPAIAQLRGLQTLEQARHTAAWHGEKDLKGVYRAMLNQTTPQAICRRFASIYSQLYSFGKCEVTREEPGRVESAVQGMPEPLAEWWMAATEAYLAPILVRAGARQPKMVFRSPLPDGEVGGVRVVRITSHTVWG